VTFTVAGNGGSQTVVLAWGVHLASEGVWGLGNGALQYPGASRKAYASLDGGADLNVAINPDALAPAADLSIQMTGPAEVLVGAEMTYEIVVSNAGPNIAAAVQVTDVLPAGTTLVSAVTSAGTISGTDTVVVLLGISLPGPRPPSGSPC
jgi:uncharacterized repeat protein (TIGR01451 family)